MDPSAPTNPDRLFSSEMPLELSSLDEFTQKTLFIHGLVIQFKEATETERLLPLFHAITRELSSFFETARRVMTYRVAVQAVRSPTKTESIEIAELRLQNKRIAHAQAIIQYVGSVVEQTLYRRENNYTSFSSQAYQWLSVSQPHRSAIIQFKHALSLLSTGNIYEAKETLTALSPLFPKEVKDGLLSTQELGLFVQRYDDAIQASLESANQEAVSLLDLVRSRPIMASLVDYLPSKDLRTLKRTLPNWEGLTENSFPVEYFLRRAERILQTPFFSLAYAPAICRNLDRVAFYAVLRNGAEYDHLSERLRNLPSVIKLALLSVLRKDQGGLGDFLTKVPSGAGRRWLIPFVQQAVKKRRSWLELPEREENLFSFLVYLCPNDEEICEFALQNHGRALRWAGPEIKRNERLVSIAVQQDGMAIQDGAKSAQDNFDIAKTAVLKNPWAFPFISERLQANPEIRSLSKREFDLVVLDCKNS